LWPVDCPTPAWRPPRHPARIFDAIKRAGPSGIDADNLFDLILAGRGVQRSALRARVWVINDVVSDSGRRIVGTRNAGGRFHLMRRASKGTQKSWVKTGTPRQ